MGRSVACAVVPRLSACWPAPSTSSGTTARPCRPLSSWPRLHSISGFLISVWYPVVFGLPAPHIRLAAANRDSVSLGPLGFRSRSSVPRACRPRFSIPGPVGPGRFWGGPPGPVFRSPGPPAPGGFGGSRLGPSAPGPPAGGPSLSSVPGPSAPGGLVSFWAVSGGPPFFPSGSRSSSYHAWSTVTSACTSCRPPRCPCASGTCLPWTFLSRITYVALGGLVPLEARSCASRIRSGATMRRLAGDDRRRNSPSACITSLIAGPLVVLCPRPTRL